MDGAWVDGRPDRDGESSARAGIYEREVFLDRHRYRTLVITNDEDHR